MTLREQVFAQALLLAGELDSSQTELLDMLSTVATVTLTQRLREGLTPEDCKADFIAAASLYALGSLNEAGAAGGVSEFKAGDLTVKRSSDAASRCLKNQAELMIAPYLADRFSFMGV